MLNCSIKKKEKKKKRKKYSIEITFFSIFLSIFYFIEKATFLSNIIIYVSKLLFTSLKE